MKIIGYAYDADTKCPGCTWLDATDGLIERDLSEPLGLDEHDLPMFMMDIHGDEVGPIFSTDENSHTCTACREELS